MTDQNFIQNLYQNNSLGKREIDLVLCHFLQINTAELIVYRDTVPQPLQQQITTAIQNRSQGKPLAYITGIKGFWTLDLLVNEHTLIPRPETEGMVELILDWTSAEFTGSILDLGTGTGAIALSLAKERPKAQVIAVDFSKECIKTAKENQARYDLKNVEIFHSDWFNAVGDRSFDFILSNPPYVAENDPHLRDLSYEPITALTAKDEGLADLTHIIEQAHCFLKPKGRLLLEHGYNQKQALHSLLQRNCYNHVKTYSDLAGIPRITTAVD